MAREPTACQQSFEPSEVVSGTQERHGSVWIWRAVARALKKVARRTEGGEVIVGVATMGSLFLRFFQIGDDVVPLRVLDSNLTLEALSNVAVAVQAA